MPAPQKALAFLRWFCREDCIDELEGDLMEFYRREAVKSPIRARWSLRLRVIQYFRPEFLKLFHQSPHKINFGMFRNYFTTAWRNLLGSQLNALLNITGLSIGISACIVIYSITSFELSFNRDVPEGDRIYRIFSKFKGTYDGYNSGTTRGLQLMVKNEFTGLSNAVAFETFSAKVLIPSTAREPEKSFGQQDDLLITGPDYFELIKGFEWIEGDAERALSRPFQVVLTENKAAEYFGTRDFASIIGREIHYQDSLVLNVSGIVRPPSYTTDFLFTDFISMVTIDKSFLKQAGFQQDGWGSTNGGSQIVVKLSPGTDADHIRRQLLTADARYKASDPGASYYATYQLQPLSDIHFNAELGSFEPSHTANKKTLLILAVVAVMLLIIAAINFINLETAQASKRAKEVGVRKVLGGIRSQLLIQFLAQSFLVTVVATGLSVVLSVLSLRLFSDYIPAGMTLPLLSFNTIGFLLLVIAIVGSLAGFYPAVIMSSYSPVQALKNRLPSSNGWSKSVGLRRGLIVFQFAFAQVLIIGTMVMIAQINYLLHKDLGFDKDAIVTFHAPYYEKPARITVLKEMLLQIPELERVSIANSTPSSNGRSSSGVVYKSKTGDIEMQVYRKGGDENYIPLFGLKLISGRTLLSSDTTNQVIVNETYLKLLHLKPEEAVGQEVWMSKKPFTIIGVVRDFNTVSLREGLQPVILTYQPENFYEYAVKIRSTADVKNMNAALAKMETSWKRVFPDEPFSAEFFDQTIANFYKTEQSMSTLTTSAMTIAILICSLGLFGLVSFNAVSRTKEIGVRKVLGATVGHIVILLSKDIILLVAIAFVIAVPVSYYAASQFLETYAFHTTLGWPLFAAGGIASVLLALVTASQQAIRAAIADPVKSLRTE